MSALFEDFRFLLRRLARIPCITAVAVLTLAQGIGSVGSLALARVLSNFLFGMTATDPATYAAGSLLLGNVALGASNIPARRATKVDPWWG